MRLLWVTAHLALAALALAYWDIYLFKRFMQSPGVVVLLLAAIFAVAFTLRELARRVPTAERGWNARLWASPRRKGSPLSRSVSDSRMHPALCLHASSLGWTGLLSDGAVAGDRLGRPVPTGRRKLRLQRRGDELRARDAVALGPVLSCRARLARGCAISSARITPWTGSSTRISGRRVSGR